MNLFFWRRTKQQHSPVQVLARNLVFVATDPDKCWELASGFRTTSMPSNVLTCEVSFLIGSLSIGIVDRVVPSADHEQAVAAAEQAYVEIFAKADEEGMDAPMASVFGPQKLSQVAALARRQYSEASDVMQTAVATFARRIKGDPRMAFEISPLIEQRMADLQRAFQDLLVGK